MEAHGIFGLRAVSPRIMLLLIPVHLNYIEMKIDMYDQYKVNLKERVLQVSIDQSKMSFQTSMCWNQKFKSK